MLKIWVNSAYVDLVSSELGMSKYTTVFKHTDTLDDSEI